MDGFRFDTAAYLDRMRLSGAPPPTADGLRTLLLAQYRHIPFENFDIQLDRGVDLAPGPLFDKLVHRPRGGYCFELNGLFLMALGAFGFSARALLARIHLTGEPSGRGHQISLVDIGGRRWLADVGFGRHTPRGPYPLEPDVPQDIGGQTIRLTDDGPFGFMLQARDDDGWRNLYSFDMEHVFPADIAYGNHYTSTSTASFFTTSRVAMAPRGDGAVSLFNRTLTLHRSGRREERLLPEGQGYLDALKTYFGIELDAPYEALRPLG